MKRLWLGLLAVLLLALLAGLAVLPGYVDRQMNVVAPTGLVAVSEEARRLHDALFVADLHDDLLLWDRDPLERAAHGHTDVPRLIEGNVALQVFSAVTKTPRGLNYERNDADSDMVTPLVIVQGWPLRTWTSLAERALYQADRLHAAAARAPDHLVVIETRDDLSRYLARRARTPAMTAGLLAIEGLHALDGDIATLQRLYDAGYRMMGLTHFFDNEVAGSAHGVARGGLTALGRDVVRRMEALGILVDLAHASPQTVDEVLAMATRPVVVSHTGVQATCPGPRNLTDDQLRRIAATGGLVGIGFWDGAVCEIGPRSTARALRHAADVAGVRHVALGSDYDGATTVPFDAADLVQLTQALMDEGFTPDEVRAIMGGNVLRLLLSTLPASSGR